MNMAPAPAPELLVFMSVAPAPELSFIMAAAPAPASVRFHTLRFQLSWCASSEMENDEIKYTKLREYTKLFSVIYSGIFFTSRALIIRKSAKKQQSQIQTIQRTIIIRNVTQDNGKINNFQKGSRWFCRQCLRSFCCFLRPESRKGLFVKLHLCPRN